MADWLPAKEQDLVELCQTWTATLREGAADPPGSARTPRGAVRPLRTPPCSPRGSAPQPPPGVHTLHDGWIHFQIT
ncbi:MAG: hypothetical protein LBE17_08515 [Treponema sp.]|jgi:hypothetical protein|nr:hypothetical protein [Treponema sp.]